MTRQAFFLALFLFMALMGAVIATLGAIDHSDKEAFLGFSQMVVMSYLVALNITHPIKR